MKQLLWIGSFLTKEIADKIHKLGYKNPASLLSQSNILTGIEYVTGEKFDTINAVSLSGFPEQSALFLKDIHYSHKAGCEDVLVGYLNLMYFNKMTSKYSLEREAVRWAQKHKTDEVDIFVYEMRSACLSAAIKVKKMIPNSKINLIVPDLPQFMDLNMGVVKQRLKELDWVIIKKYLSKVDNYILYSEPMADYLNIRDKSWMVMEGSINANEIDNNTSVAYSIDKNKTIVMYSGSIQIGFGIKNLIDAFQYLDDTYELWITGGGTAREIVEEYSKKDQRICYFGYLSTREELKSLQSRATMMVNMRNPQEKASSYCFPSKLFEYMLLGKPVLSCRSQGIPDEYFNHLVEMDSIDARDIANAIIKVAKMPDRLEFGTRGRDFIIENKTNIVQANRIINFCNL